MRKFISIFIILFLLSFNFVYAQSPTPSDEASPTPDLINQLKEKIASRVAQLKLVERRGLIGKVQNVTNTQITISDLQNNNRFVDVDELTKFVSPKTSESFGISDITKGSTIGVLGLYNKESKRILARFINVVTLPLFIHGTVASIDKENYVLTVSSDDKKQLSIDIENTTKTSSYTKDSDLVRSGFSKLKLNEKVFIVGTYDAKNKDEIIALRIIRFPEIQTSTPQVSPLPTVATSSESGKKSN